MMKQLFLSTLFIFNAFLISQAQIVDSLRMDSIPDIDIPVFSLSGMSDSDDGQAQELSILLQSSRDIFVSMAGYTFGPLRYRIRGLDSEYLTVLMGGVPMNDMETGRAYWSNWGGLNDVTRNADIKTGIVASQYSFGGVAGVTRIINRPSTYAKQLRLTYSATNRSYRNRLMATWASGITEKGWSFVFSASRRWAEEGYVEGTFYDAWAYWIGVEKKLPGGHSMSLVAFGAPVQRGGSGAAIQEAYDLTGTNFYNPYWGYQSGEKRNARVSNYHQPVITLTHYWDVSEKLKCQGSLTYWFGRGGYTALNWTDAGDPRPDYYRYFPSYWESTGEFALAEYYREQWKNNDAWRQIKWDNMYFANSKWLYTVDDAQGIEGNDVTFLRSKYIVEDRRNDKQDFFFNWHLNNFVNDHLTITAGIDLKWHKGRRYNVVEDLLGGEYWLDIDRFADGDPYIIPLVAQNDLNNINNLVKEGDVFGHDYTANINQQFIFGQADFTYNKVDFYAALELSHTVFWRTGHMVNGRYPLHSYGDSEKNNFYNYALKGGITYKINGRNFIQANGLFRTRAPFFWNSYVSPRTREFTVEGLTSEQVVSGDLSYVLRSPVVKARATVYYVQFTDQTWSRSFYHDVLNSFVNYMMTGVSKRNVGFELGIEATVTLTWTITGVLGMGQYIYNSRPVATITSDNTSEVLASDRVVYFENYYVGGVPQTIGSVGVRYWSPKYWFLGANANYFGDAYIEPNPDRRTAEANELFYEGDIRLAQNLEQEKLDPSFSVDLYGGKSWRIKRKYILGFTLSFTNILNNTNYAMSGYEQLRYDPAEVDKFPPRYYYMYGRNFFLNLTFRM